MGLERLIDWLTANFFGYTRVRSLRHVSFEAPKELVDITVACAHEFYVRCGAGWLRTHNCLLDDLCAEQAVLSNPDGVFDTAWEYLQVGPFQRLMPGGRILQIATRWGTKDPIGRTLSWAKSNPLSPQWDEIRFPAILPSGKSLWPEQWPIDQLIAKRESMYPQFWAAQYMQALALDTPVPTPSGWTTMGALKEGDYVIGANGSPTKVVWKSPTYTQRPAYKVESDDGATVIADEDHLWEVELYRLPGGPVLRTTKQLFDRQNDGTHSGGRRPRIRDAGVWDLPYVGLPLDPYVLGAWLGNGSRGTAQFTCDDKDAQHWKNEFAAVGFELTKHAKRHSYGVLGLRTALRLAGVLHKKHVPKKYLRACAGQRLALLQGLMDTDGACNKNGQAVFSNTNLDLIEAVEELVLSFGGKPHRGGFVAKTHTFAGKVLKESYCHQVFFYLEDAFRMLRKRERSRGRKTKHGRFIRVTQAGLVDTCCIRVEAQDGLFLAGKKALITHNCPTSEEGSLIKREWWKKWELEDPPTCEYIIMALDAAAETTNRSDHTSITVWGVFQSDRFTYGASHIILLDSINERMEFPKLKDTSLEQWKKWNPDCFIVERKSSGAALYQELRRLGIPVQEFMPSKASGDKYVRLNAVADIFRSGLVWYPAGRKWAEEVVEQVAAFPYGDGDDIVDTTSMAMARFRNGGFIRLPSDEEDEASTGFRKKRGYYV